jgi:hypothetical protein
MTTRAASATISLRAKQALVQVLFGADLARKGPQTHGLLDHSIYSYADLRSAYLERIHKIHPDKQKSQQTGLMSSLSEAGEDGHETSATMTDASRFVELQEAWNRYEAIAKISKKVGKGDCKELDANFVMFGVGCSFSDNEEEREVRAKIMDQASRGWFSAGELCDTKNDESARPNDKKDHVLSGKTTLVCDDLFEARDEELNDKTDRQQCDRAATRRGTQRSLVSHLIPPHRR